MKKVIVLTTAYNCASWIQKCIHTIQVQSHGFFECFILDDLSTDNTVELAEKAIKGDPRFKIIKNEKKMYQPGNYDQILRSDTISDDDIVIEVDGDDWLATSKAFEKVVKLHEDGFLITHGSFIYADGRLGFNSPFKVADLRKNPHLNATHLRSWRAKLWKKINPDHLKVNGDYASTAGDVFFMLPMLEMAGDNRIYFNTDILYVYNEFNPINDHKVDAKKQFYLAAYARALQKYETLP